MVSPAPGREPADRVENQPTGGSCEASDCNAAGCDEHQTAVLVRSAPPENRQAEADGKCQHVEGRHNQGLQRRAAVPHDLLCSGSARL